MSCLNHSCLICAINLRMAAAEGFRRVRQKTFLWSENLFYLLAEALYFFAHSTLFKDKTIKYRLFVVHIQENLLWGWCPALAPHLAPAPPDPRCPVTKPPPSTLRLRPNNSGVITWVRGQPTTNRGRLVTCCHTLICMQPSPFSKQVQIFPNIFRSDLFDFT